LFENLKSGERWVREMTRLELMGRNEARSDTDLNGFDPQKLQAFWMKLDPADPKTDHVLFEILGVFESRGITEGRLLNRLLESKNANARAYAAGVVARWWTGKDPGIDAIYDEMAALVFGAVDDHPRVRLAAMIAAANVGKPVPAIVAASEINKELAATVFAAAEKAAESGDRQYALDVNAMHSRADRDKFTDVALRSAVAGLQRNSAGDPKIQAKFAELQRPPGSPKSAPSAKSADKISATVPATGKLRATPEFVAALVHEVRDSGDVKHGGEVFRRAELACTACHSIADQGGKIGPPLDAIGSGQPLDFIIGATLEPQREIKESYEALQLTAKDGRTALGYIAARDPQQTTVRDPATGAETKFANTDIAEQKQLGSFMPAGLVDNLSREDLRDLFAYLAQLGKPK
jgi:putative heme-binding domain-containing protein